MLGYFLYRLIAFVSQLLPRSIGGFVALVCAEACHLFDRPGREAVRNNLRLILGDGASDARVRHETRETFRCFGKYMVEFVGSRGYNAGFIERRVTFEGLEHIRSAVAGGRGAVLVSAHLGNWEMGGPALSSQGMRVLAIVQPHPNRRVHRFFMSRRRDFYQQVLPVGSAALPLLRHLRTNGLVALLGDRPYGEEGIAVEFFGRPAVFPTGPARLALYSEVALVPWFLLRRSDDSFIFRAEPPIPRPAAGTRKERIREVTQAYARVLEGYVRANPSQWAVFYPVWNGSGRAPADPRSATAHALQPVEEDRS